MNLAQHLVRSGSVHRDRHAIVVGTQQLHSTYGQLARQVSAMAGGFAKMGLRPGDRVALVMKNAPEFVESLYAAWHAGLVAVPVNPRLHVKELAYILRNSGARMCIATPELAAEILESRNEIENLEWLVSTSSPDYARLAEAATIPVTPRAPVDGAWLFYTSGTTGRPKGAELSHRNLLLMTAGYFVDYEGVSPDDPLLHIGPMCHGSGLYLMTRVAAGAAQVIPESGGFDPAEVFGLLRAHRNVSFFAAPTIVNKLVVAAKGEDSSHLRTIIYGGAPMYVEDIKKAMVVLGPKFAQVYGQGETPMAISVLAKSVIADTAHPDYEQRLASVGVPQSVVRVKIAGAADLELPPGEVGEVLVAGDTVMNGYWNNQAATETTLKGGWLHTGDVGVMSLDGFITLKDRSKDVIISGGSNVYPREVEEVIMRHPRVAEVSVIGQRDAEWGECVVAFVACHPGVQVSDAELDALCLQNIARYKRPRKYLFLPTLPKSHIGKTLKTELRALLERM